MPPAPPTDSAADGLTRRTHLRLLSRSHGLDQPTSHEATWQHRKFVTRARALFYVRLTFLSLALGLVLFPPWASPFGFRLPTAIAVLATMLLYAVASLLVVPHRRAGPIVAFATLCLDTLAVLYLIVASGGLSSPLLASQLMLTTVFAILFPKPLAILPSLLTLPVITRIDQLLGKPTVLFDLFVLLWFCALNLVVVYVIVFLNQREDASHREVVQLQRELRELAVVEERSRLAREIHDGLGGSLSSLILQSEYLETLVPAEGALRDEVHAIRASAEEAIDELRRSLKMMHEDFDLVQAAEEHCRSFEARGRLPVRFLQRGPQQTLSSEAQLAIFRVLQEALTNAARHAKANEVVVELAFESFGCMVTVRDDGVGFDGAGSRPGHFGLHHMHERARRCGGELVVQSGLGEGTEIRLTIPYRTKTPEQEAV